MVIQLVATSAAVASAVRQMAVVSRTPQELFLPIQLICMRDEGTPGMDG